MRLGIRRSGWVGFEIWLIFSGSSLSGFTISDMDKFRTEHSFGAALAESLFDHLLRRENIRGAGRLFLP